MFLVPNSHALRMSWPAEALPNGRLDDYHGGDHILRTVPIFIRVRGIGAMDGAESKIMMSLASLILTVLSGIALPEPAVARIHCQGNFQITKHGPIDTPYCEEEQIAIVAQSYGLGVSASEIHNNPLKKIQVCQVLGGDTRLKGSCPVRGKRNG
jgi:hypothetical protein